MLLYFHLHYVTSIGEQIGIEFFSDSDKKYQTHLFHSYDGRNWSGVLELKDKSHLSYNYALYKNGSILTIEWGKERILRPVKSGQIYIEDKWRPRAEENNAFLSTAFTESIFRRLETNTSEKKKQTQSSNIITFSLHSASIKSNLKFGIIGNIPELGSWKNPLWMDDAGFPLWSISVPFDGKDLSVEYKYVVMDPSDDTIQVWEDGNNRNCYMIFHRDKDNHVIITDEIFRYKNLHWRGAGVAIPVFSIRSQNGMGIGEYADLKLLTDWTARIGMNIIQVLPVNDTIANKTWQDSYPYAAISVFALNPLYINIPDIAPFKIKTNQRNYEKIRKALNQLESVDFEKVLENKFIYLHILFEQEYDHFKTDPAALEFIKSNAEWLKTYAVFCHLKDKNGTCNFNLWPDYATYTPDVITSLCQAEYADIKEVEFYYFIQYHADKQLTDAKDYARKRGVVLKGDLPIGIYRYSCDAWVSPELYNMNEQAGAPPDDYAVLGQNWGFPTYNWSVMAKDGFAWWRKRMHQLNRYFDALRIDHILGFFRIWQIPTNQVEGTMGSFNPRMPMALAELAEYGISGDFSRYTVPFISDDMLTTIFEGKVKEIFKVFFDKNSNGKIVFKPAFTNQEDIILFTAQHPKFQEFEKNLTNLMSEVLLLVEPESNSQYYNPRITLTTTHSFSQLDDDTKSKFNRLHNDYFFKRHNEYWKEQALWKLPPILDASNMLICGEDLGMIPKTVPGVMKDLNIITLEIQRMPKENIKFGQVRSYPYFSVCSPSCHDMSTIRGWWEGDYENAKDYFRNYLHWYGNTPVECPTEIVQAIIEDHLTSPSMLAIFPIQDLIGIDAGIRKKEASSEQINEPSNPKHYWKFRFHIPTEDLIRNTGLNDKIRSLVKKSGR